MTTTSSDPDTQVIPPLGMIGLGRMGSNLVKRLVHAGGTAVVSDQNPDAAKALAGELPEGVTAATDVADLVGKLAELSTPRVIWVMVPAEVAGDVIDELTLLLDKDDIVIDGGNSDWRDDLPRADSLASQGVRMLDIGTSGGVWGYERGYCMMVGGPEDAVSHVAPILDILSPDSDSVERTVGRTGPTVPAEQGWLHCGANGSGHFVKMVHNGIEYGLMAAYAEGLNLLQNAEPYGFDIDVPAVTELWRRGSVIGSWLLDLTASSYATNPDLDRFSGYVSDSGEGRWTLEAGVDLGVPMPVLASALFSRFSSRGEDHGANQILSAMRNEFGGHVEPQIEPPGEHRAELDSDGGPK
ncbi:MAG TPA: decarboxylating 6-phosphogluconate dehydrogenase [Microthrixaceae bacterium]|nr:decarboxylating 6-phosphogluconate dehydrogenase [Microthrixaceae bacterium]